MQFAAILEILSLLAPAFLAFGSKLIKGNEKYLIAIALFFVLKKFANVAAQQKSFSDLQAGETGYLNPNALATLFKQAMNPSGYAFLMDADGTNEELIFELAAKTNDYRSVFDAYTKQYSRNLTTDLVAELSTDDYNKFLLTLNS
tara:strand:- start:193 stop:627 length:435 start_codon:yes stop_codon:yes gene_type:complete